MGGAIGNDFRIFGRYWIKPMVGVWRILVLVMYIVFNVKKEKTKSEKADNDNEVSTCLSHRRTILVCASLDKLVVPAFPNSIWERTERRKFIQPFQGRWLF